MNEQKLKLTDAEQKSIDDAMSYFEKAIDSRVVVEDKTQGLSDLYASFVEKLDNAVTNGDLVNYEVNPDSSINVFYPIRPALIKITINLGAS